MLGIPEFLWPTPNYKTITSPYGYRKAPTQGAGVFHRGIDIGAPAGSNIIATFSGKVTYLGFYGANGYTLRISNGTYTANYSHISPYFLVYLGQNVNKGDIIANVGPKNVYNVLNNPYKDSNRSSNKRSHNRPAFALFVIYKWRISESCGLFRPYKLLTCFVYLLYLSVILSSFSLYFLLLAVL